MQQVFEEYKKLDLIKMLLLPWVVCFAAALFFFYEFIQGNMFASIADNIMADFHIGADKMTYLSSVYYLANVIFLFVAGMVLDRFSAKKTILVAMLFCVLGTFTLAYAHSFYLAMLCRFIIGIGSAFCFLGPVRIASLWFPPKRMALVTGAVVTMAMTGGMLAQYPLTKLVIEYGWRDSLIKVGCLGLIMMLFMVYWIKEKPQTFTGARGFEKKALARLKQAYFNSQTFRAALYTSLMNMAVAVFGAMAGTLYLMQRLGVSKEEAAMVNSMLFMGAILGSPLLGWCSDKLGLRVLPMKVGCFLSLLIILAIMYLPVSLTTMSVLFFLLGFFTSAQVISYALVVESSPANITATSLSLISILTQGGYIVYQNMFSTLLLWNGDARIVDGSPIYPLSSYHLAVMIIPIGLMVAWFALFRLRETHCRQVQE